MNGVMVQGSLHFYLSVSVTGFRASYYPVYPPWSGVCSTLENGREWATWLPKRRQLFSFEFPSLDNLQKIRAEIDEYVLLQAVLYIALFASVSLSV